MRYKSYLITLILLLIIGVAGRYAILGGARPVSLRYDPVAYTTTLSLRGSSDNYLPLQGIDYTLDPVKYFDNDTYAVVTIKPTASDSETLVLKKNGNGYQKIYGPSNFLEGKDFNALPSEITKYLDSKI